ncbi:MAG: transposase [Fibrobacteres bacterium]|nr:transposase [Fibrobacterota bacterium]
MGLHRSSPHHQETRPAATGEVKAWLEKEYPEIQAQAMQEDAGIWVGDETAVQNSRTNFAATHLVARLLLLQVRASSSIFTWYRRLANQARYVSNCIPRQLTSSDSRFLDENDSGRQGRKIILILDNLRVHHAKDLQPWLLENKHLIELRFLPAYSPEMNR